MADRASQLAELADHVRELTRPYRHGAEYETRGLKSHRPELHYYWTEQPALLAQVRLAAYPSASKDDIFVAMPYASRAPASVDAVALFLRVTFRAQGWLQALRIPLRPSVETNVAALAGVAGSLADYPLTLLTADVGDWHHRASVLTEWVSAPVHPRASCPACEKRGGLWLRWASKSGGCAKCGTRWDETSEPSIYLLAEHVRASA